MRILAISGSLRAASSNSRVVAALPLLAPEGVEVVVAGGLGDLPHFNPDLDGEPPPPAVAAFRAQLLAADALVICSPEYARGVAGAMKNGLDWMVSVVGFYGTPVALLNAAPRAHHAQAHMRETLSIITGAYVEAASITLPIAPGEASAEEMARDPAFAEPLRRMLQALAATPSGRVGD